MQSVINHLHSNDTEAKDGDVVRTMGIDQQSIGAGYSSIRSCPGADRITTGHLSPLELLDQTEDDEQLL